MSDPVKVLVAGLPAEMVREIGLRLRDVAISDFDNAQQMGRAAARGEARLVILSDSFPTEDAIYVARRAKDASDDMRVAYCISMQQAENALRALKDVHVDRFFLAPVDMDEMLHELAKICGVEIVAAEATHGAHIAAALSDAWDRARPPTFEKIDKLDDAAIALLENAITREIQTAAARDTLAVGEVATRFGFQKAANVAKEVAEKFAADSLTPADGLPLSEQLLSLRQNLMAPLPTPPAPAAASARNGATPSTAASAFEDSKFAGRSILVVDDEPMISRGLSSLLARRGLTVTTLNDPLRFWSVLDECKPNLILLDLEMPGLSGTELCRVVRNDRRWSALPVIFLTGHTDQASVRRIFAAGADDYVGKPFVPAELTMRIESRLTGQK
ncbi:MAG: response regulator, partial [bacterium]